MAGPDQPPRDDPARAASLPADPNATTDSSVGRDGTISSSGAKLRAEAVATPPPSLRSPARGQGGPRGPVFLDGELVAGRYRIVRFIAQGAMGEVYEVEDLTLHGRLALKTVRPSVAEDDRALDRFKREINLARRITHPNVTRIYDIGFHQPPGPASGELLLLTMELLEGETLASLVQRRGRISPAEALPLIGQVTAGLDAAHRLGIVHRDFKTANVMIESTPLGAPPRAVVTDFGLARSSGDDDSLSSISDTGAVVGTPAYMAPEQVQGHKVTSAADIYALGIVIYELVTGKRPFTGDSGAAVAIKRLMEPPAPPRTIVPDLDLTWENVILKCLERDPANRFATAGEVYRALAGETPAPPPPRPFDSARTTLPFPGLAAASGPRFKLGALAVITLVGAVLTWNATRAPDRAPPSPAVPTVTTPAASGPTVAPRKTVAVLGLRNLTGAPEADWLEVAFGRLLGPALAAGSDRGVANLEEMARLRRALAVTDPRKPPVGALAALARDTRADVIVTGAYTALDTRGGARLEVTALDPSGRVLATASMSGDDPRDVVAQLSATLRGGLGLTALSPLQTNQLRTLIPADAGARRAWAEGLQALWQLDIRHAAERLAAAVRLAPDDPWVHIAYAEALSAAGQLSEASRQSQLAADRVLGLPQEERLALEARAAELSEQLGKATDAYNALLAAHPTDVDYSTRLALAQAQGHQFRQALATVQGVRKLLSDPDPEIELAAAWAHQGLEQMTEAQAAAERAAKAASSRGLHQLVGRARLVQSVALEASGDPAKVMAAAEAARDEFQTAGDQDGTGRAIVRMAEALYDKGDLEGARRFFERAMALHKATGNRRLEARAAAGLAAVRLDQGDFTTSRNLLTDAVATLRSVGARDEEGAVLNSLGTLLQQQGDLAGAEARYKEALQAWDAVGQRARASFALTNLGEILYLRGRLSESQHIHEEGVASSREAGSKPLLAYNLTRLGMVLCAQDDLAASAARLQEALPQGGESAGIGTRIALARTRLAARDFGEARKVAREAEELARGQKATDLEAEALLVQAEAALAEGKGVDAAAMSTRAQQLAKDTQDQLLQMTAPLVAARVKAAGGAAPSAIADLRRVVASAAKAGVVPLELEARLALIEAETLAGQPDAPPHQAALQKDAAARGFLLVARRARQLTAR